MNSHKPFHDSDQSSQLRSGSSENPVWLSWQGMSADCRSTPDSSKVSELRLRVQSPKWETKPSVIWKTRSLYALWEQGGCGAEWACTDWQTPLYQTGLHCRGAQLLPSGTAVMPKASSSEEQALEKQDSKAASHRAGLTLPRQSWFHKMNTEQLARSCLELYYSPPAAQQIPQLTISHTLSYLPTSPRQGCWTSDAPRAPISSCTAWQGQKGMTSH